MKRERAVEILRWGPYAKPAPDHNERRIAIGMLTQDPTLRDALSWPSPSKKGTPPT